MEKVPLLHPRSTKKKKSSPFYRRALLSNQIICKPGSVSTLLCRASHLSSPTVANGIERVLWWPPRRDICDYSLWAASLQQAGFTFIALSPAPAVGFCPTRFTLTFFATSVGRWRFRFCGTFPRVSPGCR